MRNECIHGDDPKVCISCEMLNSRAPVCRHCGKGKIDHHYSRGGYICDSNLSWFDAKDSPRLGFAAEVEPTRSNGSERTAESLTGQVVESKSYVWWNNIKFCFHCGTPAKRWKHDAKKAWCVNCHWVIQDTLLVIIGTGRACRLCDQKVPLNHEGRHEWVGSSGGKYVQSCAGAEPESLTGN